MVQARGMVKRRGAMKQGHEEALKISYTSGNGVKLSKKLQKCNPENVRKTPEKRYVDILLAQAGWAD